MDKDIEENLSFLYDTSVSLFGKEVGTAMYLLSICEIAVKIKNKGS